ncbi:alpha-ketoacid dehydrogenase subunit beta [bacterium]|nr:alpha-ketoacid dehydrogenase subunit beta [bacterium]
MKYMESINRSLHTLLEQDERVLLLGEDLLDPYGGAFKVTKGLSTRFPDRVIPTPISESSITGVSTGLALRGFRPVMEIMFGDFLTLCTDQLVNGATKFAWMYGDEVSVPMVIRTPMGGRRGYGPTHSQTLDALYMSVPGLTMVAPGPYHDPGVLLKTAVLEDDGPLLFIENKLLYPGELLVPDASGRCGDLFVRTISQGDSRWPTISLCPARNSTPDVTLIAYGGSAHLAAKAAVEALIEEEILVEVLLPSLIKPVPWEDLEDRVRESGRVVTVEEGVLTGGWGAEVAAGLQSRLFHALRAPIQRVAALDQPIPSAKHLEDAVLPGREDILEAIRNCTGDQVHV